MIYLLVNKYGLINFVIMMCAKRARMRAFSEGIVKVVQNQNNTESTPHGPSSESTFLAYPLYLLLIY